MRPPILFFRTLGLAALMVTVFVACGNINVALKEGGNLNIQEAYVQTTVPGLGDSPAFDRLHVSFQTIFEEDCHLDSISYLSKVYYISTSSTKMFVNLSTEDGLMRDAQFSSNDTTEAVLFYSHKGQPFFLRINDVVRKETLYMP